MINFNDNIDAVILANGEFPAHEIPLQVLQNAKYVVCCDGGADAYIARGYTPNVIIGDGDSLSAENRERYSNIIYYVPDQDTNDQTKAVDFLISKGCNRIAIVGATGKREDHTIGNISLLSEYKRKGLNVACYTDYGVFVPCKDKVEMLSREGMQVSIFNVNASNFSSKGLKYPIYDFTSLWQGTLNCCETDSFTIDAKGEYLVFITY